MELSQESQAPSTVTSQKLPPISQFLPYSSSTLANLTNEIEKEEVVVFRACLRQAIANFAATDSLPSPPRVSINTWPNKGNENRKENDKNLTKKIAVATPRIVLSKAINPEMNKEVDLPSTPQTSNKTWATVARKCRKKARVVNSIETQVSAGNKNAPRVLNKDNSTIPVSDKRLFVRLLQKQERRKLSPAGIREVVVNKLAINPQSHQH
ncbi:hypothetical protein EPUL_004460 [Erysiphe pulchra]|uniref:Uncharacterized protein n=1 Tax=Erysiphe pulchra TaxID=225359 RepID=A0A2S4PPQ7_9PEZI|nr:hypothetical protein EPUL_004460 [Erysiphe pulchra]